MEAAFSPQVAPNNAVNGIVDDGIFARNANGGPGE